MEIAPLLGLLHAASGRRVHPRGEIAVDLRVADGGLTGTIALPPGVDGVLRYGGGAHPLAAGEQRVHLPAGRADAPGPPWTA